MVIKTTICNDCKKEFNYNKTKRYNRKYCDNCSKKRKVEYENLYMVKAEDCEEE
jgi:hypothetical protein